MRRPLALLAILLVAMALISGCGRGEEPGRTAPATTASETEVEPGASSEPVEEPDGPTGAALAADARFDALVTAFAPVSVRVNYLVAAETLRIDAVESGAGDAVELERFGAVRVERDRMLDVLRAARPRVATVLVADAEQQHVKELLLGAIDARRRALVQLELALDAQAKEATPDTVVEERVAAWEARWNESLRLTREATTEMQESRARLGLEPGPEEAFR